MKTWMIWIGMNWKPSEELDELDDQEPDDCLSDAYDEWEERCEELDSRIEELEELLDD